jgi:hypothetical protein
MIALVSGVMAIGTFYVTRKKKIGANKTKIS